MVGRWVLLPGRGGGGPGAGLAAVPDSAPAVGQGRSGPAGRARGGGPGRERAPGGVGTGRERAPRGVGTGMSGLCRRAAAGMCPWRAGDGVGRRAGPARPPAAAGREVPAGLRLPGPESLSSLGVRSGTLPSRP